MSDNVGLGGRQAKSSRLSLALLEPAASRAADRVLAEQFWRPRAPARDRIAVVLPLAFTTARPAR